MSHTTPQTINGRLRYFRDQIAPESDFVRVPVTGEMRKNNCFPNVKEKIKKEGGEMVIGWTIWQSPKFFEAEYHACWKKDGQLFDITLKEDGEKVILFLPDPSKTEVPTEIEPGKFMRVEHNRILPHKENRLYRPDYKGGITPL